MSNFSNYPDTIGMSELRYGTSALAAIVAAEGLIAGRFYYNTDANALYRALSDTDLGAPYARGSAAVDDLAAQFATHVSTYNTFVSNTNDALADRPTLSEADARFLGITAKAADSTLFDGHSYNAVVGSWQTDIATSATAIRAALANNVLEIGGIQLSQGQTISFADLTENSSIGKPITEIEDGKVQVFVQFATPTETATVTIPGGGTQVVSNGDSFVFLVAGYAVSGTPTFINNLDNLKFAGIDTTLSDLDSAMVNITARVAGGNATFLDEDGVLGFGGSLLQDTNVTGGKIIHFKNTMNVVNSLALQCYDDSTKFIRIAGSADGGLRYGLVSFTPFS